MENVASNMPVKSTPKDVFMHLLAFVALYASAVTLMALLFQYINVWFPDPLDYYSSVQNTIRYSASFLVVLYPVFLIMSWLINREFTLDPARREIRVRKWLIYLTLFVSALTVIGDVITLVYNLLGGEFTTRFILKILVVLLVSGGIFAFYIWDLKGKMKNLKALAWIVSLVVLGVIVAGFVIVGSPARQRSLKFDQQRVSDLQSIQSQTINFWQQKGKLPASLNDLTDSISGFKAPTDPQTSQAYDYTVESDLSFQLCANFSLPSENDQRTIPMLYPSPDNWSHSGGHFCFDRSIDPQLYKPITPPVK
jgi:hypothetical protein